VPFALGLVKDALQMSALSTLIGDQPGPPIARFDVQNFDYWCAAFFAVGHVSETGSLLA
jgi:hypothetical protein